MKAIKTVTVLVAVMTVFLGFLGTLSSGQKTMNFDMGNRKVLVSVNGKDSNTVSILGTNLANQEKKDGKDAEAATATTLHIKLPPAPKAATSYQAATEEDNSQDLNSQVSVAPQIIVVQPANSNGPCTDNCDAQQNPAPVQIAGPIFQSQLLGDFDDKNMVSVPETQVYARPAAQDFATIRYGKNTPGKSGIPVVLNSKVAQAAAEAAVDDDEDDDDDNSFPQNSEASSNPVPIVKFREVNNHQQQKKSSKHRHQQKQHKQESHSAHNDNQEDLPKFKQIPPYDRQPAAPVTMTVTTCAVPPCLNSIVKVSSGLSGIGGCCNSDPCDAGQSKCPTYKSTAARLAAEEAAAAERRHQELMNEKEKLYNELSDHEKHLSTLNQVTRKLRYQYAELRSEHQKVRALVEANQVALKNLDHETSYSDDLDIEGPAPDYLEDLKLLLKQDDYLGDLDDDETAARKKEAGGKGGGDDDGDDDDDGAKEQAAFEKSVKKGAEDSMSKAEKLEKENRDIEEDEAVHVLRVALDNAERAKKLKLSPKETKMAVETIRQIFSHERSKKSFQDAQKDKFGQEQLAKNGALKQEDDASLMEVSAEAQLLTSSQSKVWLKIARKLAIPLDSSDDDDDDDDDVAQKPKNAKRNAMLARIAKATALSKIGIPSVSVDQVRSILMGLQSKVEYASRQLNVANFKNRIRLCGWMRKYKLYDNICNDIWKPKAQYDANLARALQKVLKLPIHKPPNPRVVKLVKKSLSGLPPIYAMQIAKDMKYEKELENQVDKKK